VQLLAAKLAMPAERVSKLLAGRFRVHTAVDGASAQRLVRELEACGVRAVAAPLAKTGGAVAAPPPPAPAPAPSDDGGISIGDLDFGLPAGGLAPPKAAEPAPPQHGFLPSSFGPPAGQEDAPLQLERPAAPPARPAPAAAPPPPAAPAANRFAPPDEQAEAPLALAAPSKAKPRAAGPAASTPQAALTAGRSAPAHARGASTITRPSRAAVPSLARTFAVLVVALTIGYFPALLYAKHVDDTQVAQRQKEYVMLKVNPWKGEVSHRTQEMVQKEIVEMRGNATLLMMGIWAACAGLLATLAYVLL
jgi:hypothetical protein